MERNNINTWICSWYEENCDGDWEHSNGVKIETIDNPGWSISIDTKYSLAPLHDIKWELHEKNSEDWYGFKVVDGVFSASGDSQKLEFLLKLFRKKIEQL